MAVVQDVGTENVRTGTTSPQTFSHGGAASGVKAVAIAIVHGTSATDHVSAVSYGGVACQRIVRATDTATEPGAAEIWFLGTGVPQGTQTVSYTPGATTDDIHCVCTTFLADADCIVIDFDSVSENTANPAVTLQYGGRSALAYGALYGGGSAPSSFTPNGNCTAEHDHDLGAFYSAVLRQTTAGTSDFEIGGTASSDDVAFVAIAISEKQALTLTAEQGSYSLNGQAQALRDHPRIGNPAPLPSLSLLGGFSPAGGSVTMPAEQGTYTLSGQAQNLKFGHVLPAEQGSYSLDGQAQGLKRGYPLVAAQESYTLSGQDAALRAARTLALAQGEYALSGQSNTLTYGHPMSAVQGEYTLDGQAVSLVYGHPMPAAQGEYALDGQSATLTAQRILAAAQGDYSLDGQAVFLLYGNVMAPEQGAYSLDGQAVTLLAARTLALDSGEYELSGQDATLVYDEADKVLVAESGDYSLDGQAVTLTYDSIVEPEPEAPAKGGGNPGLTRKQFKEHLERIRRERAREVAVEVQAEAATTAGQVFVFAPITEPREAVVIPAPMKIRKSRRKKDEEELLRYGLLD